MNTTDGFVRVGLLFGAAAIFAAPAVSHAEFGAEEAPAAPSLQADAEDLKGTIVTPHLDQEIPDKTNVVWCGAFQLAWNELCKRTGGRVDLEPPSSQAEALNKKAITTRDLDRSSYVAAAGPASRGFAEKVHEEVINKFGNQAGANLLELHDDLPADGWVTYAYLSKELPFRRRFGRFDNNLTFDGAQVDSFGIRRGVSKPRLDSQVTVLDYVSNDDVILELQTVSKKDRLLLAKIPAEKTLAAAIATVQRRIASSEETSMESTADLLVPVFDFTILKRYSELAGRRITGPSRRLSEQDLRVAAQSIRFRLDERGAVLKSEALLGGGGSFGDQNLIFDKPFLVLLQRSRADNPYFAMWVGNAELLVTRVDESTQE